MKSISSNSPIVISASVGIVILILLAAYWVRFTRPKGHGRTGMTAIAIQQAINAFESEYGRMPVEGTNDRTLDTAKHPALLEVLLGMNSVLNPRGLNFLSIREGRDGKNGLIYASDGGRVEGIYDPWGRGYRIRLDLDGNGKIRVHGEILQVRVAVWSPGPDGRDGTADDVKAW